MKKGERLRGLYYTLFPPNVARQDANFLKKAFTESKDPSQLDPGHRQSAIDAILQDTKKEKFHRQALIDAKNFRKELDYSDGNDHDAYKSCEAKEQTLIEESQQ